ncbi:MAG: PssD/Cps14F family polysaccharide biosynthesis glycosyltransferase [Candidatus Saccharibacteria bacterium]|nr:PssD/Cps14F family polysaccharide biosynthesis glycosyltransferase [Candidatus Saccharibacteria bacterium]
MSSKGLEGKKICLVGSSGGHLAHLYALKPLWGKTDRFWVTFDKEDANSLLEGEKVYHCHFPSNRSLKALRKNTKLAKKVLAKEKPDIIISTGAAAAVPFFYVGRKYGAKTIYIEVLDRVDKPTLTGRFVYRMSDKFIVQWDEMKKVYKKAINLGSIF